MKISDMPVFKLEGSPSERGYQYGRAAKAIIAQSIECWRSDLGTSFNTSEKNINLDAQSYLKSFFADTDYLAAINKWAPDLLNEVIGIADGAEQSLDNILGLQLLDEEWVYGMHKQIQKQTNKCTAFGLPDVHDGVSYAGQNMDVGKWVDGKQALLQIMRTENTPEILLFTFAGSMGLIGLNSSGLGVTCNTLTQLNHATDGLPVSFIVRKLLEYQSIDHAESFLRDIKHASGQNYILASIGDVRCFECCGTSVVSYQPKDHSGRIFHTNHPLVSCDESDVLSINKSRGVNTVARLNSITNRLGRSDYISLDEIKAALSSHDDPDNPVSRNVNNDGCAIGYTIGSVIYEFGETPRLHLASGPPCEIQFKTFEFSHLKVS